MSAKRHCLRAFAVLVAMTMPAPPLDAQTVARVNVNVADREAWTGQRIRMEVELRSRASFGGATSFYLPDVPKTLILKVGNPVVSSRLIDGDTWAVQIHELAIFSQIDGKLVVPEFPVHFGARDTYTGPVEAMEETVPAQEFQIQRPPGSEGLAFVVTTESLELEETWAPEPGPMKSGAVIKRTVTQRAAGLTGMALAPMPATAPEGVRVYPGNPEVNDATGRGAFVGERKETLAYKLQQPGTITLPAVRFVWWNPESERLLTKTLPAVEIESQAPLASEPAPPVESGAPWTWSLLLGGIAVLLLWQRKAILRAVRRIARGLDPPDRVTLRRLLGACRHDDAPTAYRAWMDWSATGPRAGVRPPADLRTALDELERRLYGSAARGEWDGDRLSRAVRRFARETHELGRRSAPEALPPLNPASPDAGPR